MFNFNFSNKSTYLEALTRIIEVTPKQCLMLNDQGNVIYASRFRQLWENFKGRVGRVDHTKHEEVESRIIAILTYGTEKTWLSQKESLDKAQNIAKTLLNRKPSKEKGGDYKKLRALIKNLSGEQFSEIAISEGSERKFKATSGRENSPVSSLFTDHKVFILNPKIENPSIQADETWLPAKALENSVPEKTINLSSEIVELREQEKVPNLITEESPRNVFLTKSKSNKSGDEYSKNSGLMNATMVATLGFAALIGLATFLQETQQETHQRGLRLTRKPTVTPSTNSSSLLFPQTTEALTDRHFVKPIQLTKDQKDWVEEKLHSSQLALNNQSKENEPQDEKRQGILLDSTLSNESTTEKKTTSQNLTQNWRTILGVTVVSATILISLRGLFQKISFAQKLFSNSNEPVKTQNVSLYHDPFEQTLEDHGILNMEFCNDPDFPSFIYGESQSNEESSITRRNFEGKIPYFLSENQAHLMFADGSPIRFELGSMFIPIKIEKAADWLFSFKTDDNNAFLYFPSTLYDEIKKNPETQLRYKNHLFKIKVQNGDAFEKSMYLYEYSLYPKGLGKVDTPIFSNNFLEADKNRPSYTSPSKLKNKYANLDEILTLLKKDKTDITYYSFSPEHKMFKKIENFDLHEIEKCREEQTLKITNQIFVDKTENHIYAYFREPDNESVINVKNNIVMWTNDTLILWESRTPLNPNLSNELTREKDTLSSSILTVLNLNELRQHSKINIDFENMEFVNKEQAVMIKIPFKLDNFEQMERAITV